jgi:SAM-dependent methyltransferase
MKAAKPVSYERQTVNSPNPLARFAHKSRIARSQAIAKRHLPKEGAFVDFGAGTGLLLHQLRQDYPNADLIGIEPFMASSYPGSARYLPSLADLAPLSVDAIGVFEVCEHLNESQIRDFLGHCQRVLRPDGRLLVSVPIMYGATVPLKTFNHVALHHNTDYSFMDVVRSTLGVAIKRPEEKLTTHKGFDFRWLKRLIGQSFEIQSMQCSPLPALPWFLNSQIFLVCGLPNVDDHKGRVVN